MSTLLPLPLDWGPLAQVHSTSKQSFCDKLQTHCCSAGPQVLWEPLTLSHVVLCRTCQSSQQ